MNQDLLARIAAELRAIQHRAHIDDVTITVAKLIGLAGNIERAIRERRPTAAQLFADPIADAAIEVPTLRFTVPTPPAAKNSRRIFRTGAVCPKCRKPTGHLGSSMSDEARHAREKIIEEAVDALRRQAPQAFSERRPLLPDEDVGVTVVHNVKNDTADVVIEKRGPKPAGKGPTGRRRDVTNVPELVLDAVQGIAYHNDNQVADLRVWRNVGEPSNLQPEMW